MSVYQQSIREMRRDSSEVRELYREWISITLKQAFASGLVTMDAFRKAGGDYALLQNRIYYTYGTLKEAIQESDLQKAYDAAKLKIGLRDGRLRLRKTMEAIAKGGGKVCLGYSGTPVRNAYQQLMRLGESGRKLVRAELHRLWNKYGPDAFDPKTLPMMKLNPEDVAKLNHRMESVIAVIKDERPGCCVAEGPVPVEGSLS